MIPNVSKREIDFWQRQVDQGRIIHAVRSYRRRAIRFFGAPPVLAENLSQLYQIAEARKILAASDESLLAQMNRVPTSAAEELEGVTAEERRKLLERWRFTGKDIQDLKSKALRYLEAVFET